MNDKLLKRIAAQSEEAEKLGLTTLAEDLKHVLISKADVKNEVMLKKISRQAVWDVAFAVIDFYKIPVSDGAFLSNFIDEWGDQLLDQVKETLEATTKKKNDKNLPGQE